MYRAIFVIFAIIIGVCITPNVAYACSQKAEKTTCCKSKTNTKSSSCCSSKHKGRTDDCGGNCGDSCHCLSMSSVALPPSLITCGFFEKQILHISQNTFYYIQLQSEGHVLIWSLPKIC